MITYDVEVPQKGQDKKMICEGTSIVKLECLLQNMPHRNEGKE